MNLKSEDFAPYNVGNECWGQGTYVWVCQTCRANDYGSQPGSIIHRQWCLEVGRIVEKLREGYFEGKSNTGLAQIAWRLE